MKCNLCNKCEELPVMYLPGEAEKIAKKLGITPDKLGKKSKQGFYYIGKNDKDCIYLQNGKCQMYELRPLDCRSFPIVPFYDKKMRFMLINFCKAAETIDKDFIEKTINEWKKAKPSEKWLKEYSKKFRYLRQFPYKLIK